MIDNRLLTSLVCPLDHSSLHAASEQTISRLNRAIAAGRVKNRGGHVVEHAVMDALIRADETLLYPIADGIPLLVADEAIPLVDL